MDPTIFVALIGGVAGITVAYINSQSNHLKKENTTLKAKIEQLKGENTTLKAEIEQLKGENTTLKAEIALLRSNGDATQVTIPVVKITSLIQKQRVLSPESKVEQDELVEVTGTLDGPLPRDYKLYALHGNSAYLLQEDILEHNKNGERTWDYGAFFHRDTKVSIFAAGSGGQALFGYCKLLKNESIAIPLNLLPEDVIYCAEVFVTVGPPPSKKLPVIDFTPED